MKCVLKIGELDDTETSFDTCVPRSGDLVEAHNALWVVVSVTWKKCESGGYWPPVIKLEPAPYGDI